MKLDDVRLLVLWLIYFIYMVIGALLFSQLEYENENEQRRYFTALMARIGKEHNLSAEVMSTLSHAHDDACSKGIQFHGPSSNKWDFAGSFYFVGTVITTIGFGFISPVTRGGQICFIPYALLGIPLNILLFNTLLERAVLLITSFLRWGRKRFGERECKPDHKSDPGNESSSLHIGCVSFAVLLAAVLLISILFMYLEDWNYFEAVYFCVVAFTTVGFGDFVPSSSHSEHGKNHSTEYKVGNWILIIVGLVFMYPALAIAASLYKELIAHITDRCYFRVCGAQQVAPTPSVDVIRSNSLTAQSLDGIEGEVDNSLKGSTISLRSPRCQSRCSVIQLGTVSTVETSIMKSRASLRDTPTHIDEKSELDNLLATEARLTKEYVEALAILQKRKLVLTPDKDRLTDPLTHIDSPTESGVFLKVSSSYSNWCNSQQSSVSPYQPQYNS